MNNASFKATKNRKHHPPPQNEPAGHREPAALCPASAISAHLATWGVGATGPFGTVRPGAKATDQGALPTAGGPTSTAPDVTTTSGRSLFGGDDDHNEGDRPTVAEIKKEITAVLGADAEQPGAEEIIDCLAEGYYDSDLPTGVLEKVVTGETLRSTWRTKMRTTRFRGHPSAVHGLGG